MMIGVTESIEHTSECWSIVESSFDGKNNKAYEGLFTVGSGYLHVRGSLEEHLAGCPQGVSYTRMPANVTSEKFPETKAKWGAYIPGIFGNHPLLNCEMVNLPWFCELSPRVAGEMLDMEGSKITGYRRELRLHDAVLCRTLTWHTAAGAEITVSFERFISAVHPSLSVQRMKLVSAQDTVVTVRAGIDSDVRTNGYDHFTSRLVQPDAKDGIECRFRTDRDDEVRIVTRLSVEQGHAPPLEWAYVGEERGAYRVADIPLAAGREVCVEKRTALATSRDLTPVDPLALLDAVAPQSFDVLHAEHAARWAARWERSDVLIEGDPSAQMAMRSSLYHLLRVHVEGDCRVTVDAKGYAGDAYFGRFFWDSEMYLLPFYLYTDPERAKTLVDYRVHTLPGARLNAAEYGYPGARYPWEGDVNGRENCPLWQYRDHEVHITADVVYGMAHYAQATGRMDYLYGPAAEVIVEAARYWLARLDWRPGETHPSLLGVMGPDEYTPISHNNSYTNRLVKFTLSLAARMGAVAGASEKERADFSAAADGLPILRARDGKLILQCEGFEELAEPRFDEFWTDRAKTFAAHVSQERLYRSKCLKQADVLMLMMLFPAEFTDEEVRCAWEYYYPYTTHDSSLSAGAHALIACRLGLMEEAWKCWLMCADKDLDLAHHGAAEGIHIAGAGANWQIAVNGFAGMGTAMESDIFTLRPRLPATWTRLAFPVIWQGCPLFVEITREDCAVTNRGETDLPAEIAGQSLTILAGETVSIAYAAAAKKKTPAIAAVLFDLDGVLVSTDEMHYRGWKQLAEAEGIPFSRDVNTRQRGVGRMESLDILLEAASRSYTPEEKAAMAERKNRYYRGFLQDLTPNDLLPGVNELAQCVAPTRGEDGHLLVEQKCADHHRTHRLERMLRCRG